MIYSYHSVDPPWAVLTNNTRDSLTHTLINNIVISWRNKFIYILELYFFIQLGTGFFILILLIKFMISFYIFLFPKLR